MSAPSTREGAGHDPLVSVGNAYDFTRDLSTVVYTRHGGHADLYFLSQK